jgi:hypothetical protein
MSRTYTKVRPPAVAGRFYDDDASRCAEDAARLCRPPQSPADLPPTLYGGMVPHAGWVCSGRIAGMTWAMLAARTQARTIVLTGSVHTMAMFNPALDSADAWATPMGPIGVDVELRETLDRLDGFEPLDMAHQHEHSLEVEVPMIAAAFGEGVMIVPCLIPPVDEAADWGRAIGRVLADWPEPVIMVASSDLTHYGPNYRFTPFGEGERGTQWAHDVNDRALLDEIEALRAESIVRITRQHHSACGGGAIAATMAASAELGATRGIVIEHTDSIRELTSLGYTERANSVGYAGVVFG